MSDLTLHIIIPLSCIRTMSTVQSGMNSARSVLEIPRLQDGTRHVSIFIDQAD